MDHPQATSLGHVQGLIKRLRNPYAFLVELDCAVVIFLEADRKAVR
jgi:hypothetical protein